MNTVLFRKLAISSVFVGLAFTGACSWTDAPAGHAQISKMPVSQAPEPFLKPIREMGTGPEWGMVCPTYSGTEHLVERAKDTVILLGELPGTDQSAEAVVSLVCDLLANDIPVNLGLAIPDPYLQRLQDPDRKIELLRERIYDAAPILWDGEYPRFGTRGNRRLLETVLRLQQDGHDIELFGMVPEISGQGEVVRYEGMPPLIDRELAAAGARSEGEAIVFLTDTEHGTRIWRDLTFRSQHNRPVEVHVQLTRQTLFYKMIPSGGAALVWRPGNSDDSSEYKAGAVPQFQPLHPPVMPTDRVFGALMLPECGPSEKCTVPDSDGYYFTGEATLSASGFPFDPELEMAE